MARPVPPDVNKAAAAASTGKAIGLVSTKVCSALTRVVGPLPVPARGRTAIKVG